MARHLREGARRTGTARRGPCAVAWLVACAIGGAAAPAQADWHLTPFAGLKFGGATTLFDLDEAAGDKKLVYGGTATWVGRGIFGIEGDVSFVPHYLEADGGTVVSSRVTTAMGNLVVTAPRGWTRESLRPYVSGGAGLVRVRMDDAFNVLSYRRTLGGYNVGGGVVGFVTPFTGVKWDVRYFRAWGPTGEATAFGSARINFWRATMGIVFRY